MSQRSHILTRGCDRNMKIRNSTRITCKQDRAMKMNRHRLEHKMLSMIASINKLLARADRRVSIQDK